MNLLEEKQLAESTDKVLKLKSVTYSLLLRGRKLSHGGRYCNRRKAYKISLGGVKRETHARSTVSDRAREFQKGSDFVARSLYIFGLASPFGATAKHQKDHNQCEGDEGHNDDRFDG